MKKYKSGFTLLEILVVISIIGILIAVGSASYSTAQKKGRDAKRKADLKAMQNALEQYYAVNSNYGADTDCSDQLGAHMTAVPTDPKTSTAYNIICSTDGYGISADLETGDTATYTVYALQGDALEPGEGGGASPSPSASADSDTN